MKFQADQLRGRLTRSNNNGLFIVALILIIQPILSVQFPDINFKMRMPPFGLTFLN